jgi:pilus assembly protein CpaB
MRGKSLALLVLALGCGLVASLGITQVMSKREPASADTKMVVVAMKDIATGDEVKPDSVRLEPWPADKVPAHALTELKEVEGRRARTKLYSGEPILEAKLINKVDSGIVNSLIPKGYRVVPVRVDQVSGGGGLLQPGTRVDLLVYVTRNPANGFPQTMTKTILEDIKVFAVNEVVNLEANGPEPKSIQARTVSLLATPTQAEKITLASELGSIRLVMRPQEDEKGSRTKGGATAHDLFGSGSEVGNAGKETLMSPVAMEGDKEKVGGLVAFLETMRAKNTAASASPTTGVMPSAPPKPRWPFRLLKGPEVVDMEMEGADQVTDAGSASSPWKVISLPGAALKGTIDAAKPAAAEEPRGAKAEPKTSKSAPKTGKDETKTAKDKEEPKSSKDEATPKDGPKQGNNER